jgi:hypothetical protein
MLMQGNVQHCTPASAAGEFRCMLYLALQRIAGVALDATSANDVQWRFLDVLAMLGEFLAIKAYSLPTTSTPACRCCLQYLVVRMLEFQRVETSHGVPIESMRSYVNSSQQPSFAPIFDEIVKTIGKK